MKRSQDVRLGHIPHVLTLLCISAVATGACAPMVTRGGGYLGMVRPDLRPPLVSAAAKADSLWGLKDSSLTGDGIAESRRSDLQTLVERFAPTLILPGNDFARVGDQRFRMIPTNALLFAETLRLDMINAAPYRMVDTQNFPFLAPDTDKDSLVRVVRRAMLYDSDPNLLANLYFDFPGDNPRQWWRAYGEFRTGPDSARWAKPTVYAHPFIESRGLLAIQYWLFYPFNDFVGNHEGDWEHIVVITTPDHQAIKEVHYYFHQRSIVLPQGNFKPDTVDGTHPVIHVGGRMYHLPDYPIRLLAGEHNEGSHGSYPYAGEWEGVAGLGASESVQRVDAESLRVVSYREFDVILTPEPGSIDFVRRPEVLREWGWLLLPARWGFPVTTSVGSELNMDVGNRAPYGPAFSTGWNRTAPGLLFPGYIVRRIPKLQSYLEDLLQPWYYPYIFRTPRFIHDTRDTLPHRALELLGLAPRGGAGERGFGTTALGLSFAYPTGEFDDDYQAGKGFLMWRSLWAKMRVGAVELAAGYQRFPRGPDSAGTFYVYPVTAAVVIRGPGGRFRPYAGVGGGLYGWQSRTPQSQQGSYLAASGWSWGWNTQVGIEYYMRPTVALDIGLRWHGTRVNGEAAGLAHNSLRFMSLWVGHYLRF